MTIAPSTAPSPPAPDGGTPFGPLPKDLPALTSVRFFLALGVVAFHYHFNTPFEGNLPTELVARARLGVDAFFILSGFVLAHVYGPQVAEGRYSHRQFLWARIARIYPAHLAMLAFMGLVALAALAAGEPIDPGRYSLAGFFQTLFLVHAWFPTDAPVEWNGPTWSLSAEWAAYLIFPLFAAIALALRRAPLALIALAVAMFLGLDFLYRSLFSAPLTSAEFNLGVLRIVPEFLLGIGLRGLAGRLSPDRTTSLVCASAAGVLVVGLMHFGADERIVVGAAGLLILALALLGRSGPAGWLSKPVMIEAGEASYALYVIHFPMLVAWRNGRGLVTGSSSDYLMPAAEAFLMLAATVATAFLLHAFWERPARRWIRQRFMDQP